MTEGVVDSITILSKTLRVSVIACVQLEVIDQVMGYSEYDLTQNKHVDTVMLKYPPTIFKTVGLVGFNNASSTWSHRNCNRRKHIFVVHDYICDERFGIPPMRSQWSFCMSLIHLRSLFALFGCIRVRVLIMQKPYTAVVGPACRGHAKAEAHGVWDSTRCEACNPSSSCFYDHEYVKLIQMWAREWEFPI